MNKIIIELANKCIPRLMKGASKEQVENQESTLNYAFPSDYADFLQYTNGGEVFDGDITLFSIYDSSTKVNIKNTIGFVNRPGAESRFSTSSYLKIGEYNYGDPILLDKTDGQVIHWSHEYNEVLLSYSGFKEFLESVINDHIVFES